MTLPEIIDLRGVKSGGVIKTLLEKRLIRITGRKEVVGRPMLYGTTKEFLLQFGLKDLAELPRIEEFAEVLGEEVDVDGLKRAIEAPTPADVALADDDDAQAELPLRRTGGLMQERLQKILSRAGIASRRAAEQVMADGRVTVNGETVRELGTKADVTTDDIRVDGVRIRPPADPVYLLLYKPRGVVTTRHDPEGRATVMDLVPPVAGLFPVGRLDVGTEGLLILTNDGDFAQRVSHPRYEVPRVYQAKVRDVPSHETLARLHRRRARRRRAAGRGPRARARGRQQLVARADAARGQEPRGAAADGGGRASRLQAEARGHRAGDDPRAEPRPVPPPDPAGGARA